MHLKCYMGSVYMISLKNLSLIVMQNRNYFFYLSLGYLLLMDEVTISYYPTKRIVLTLLNNEVMFESL